MLAITNSGRCSIVAVVTVAATVGMVADSANAGSIKEIKSLRKVVASPLADGRIGECRVLTASQVQSFTISEYSVTKISENQVANTPSSVSLDSLLEGGDQSFKGLISQSRKEMAAHLSAGQVDGLKKLRLEAGLSQKQLADIVGVEQPHISRLERNGGDIKSSRLTALADALGVSDRVVYEALNGQA